MKTLIIKIALILAVSSIFLACANDNQPPSNTNTPAATKQKTVVAVDPCDECKVHTAEIFSGIKNGKQIKYRKCALGAAESCILVVSEENDFITEEDDSIYTDNNDDFSHDFNRQSFDESGIDTTAEEFVVSQDIPEEDEIVIEDDSEIQTEVQNCSCLSGTEVTKPTKAVDGNWYIYCLQNQDCYKKTSPPIAKNQGVRPAQVETRPAAKVQRPTQAARPVQPLKADCNCTKKCPEGCTVENFQGSSRYVCIDGGKKCIGGFVPVTKVVKTTPSKAVMGKVSLEKNDGGQKMVRPARTVEMSGSLSESGIASLFKERLNDIAQLVDDDFKTTVYYNELLPYISDENMEVVVLNKGGDAERPSFYNFYVDLKVRGGHSITKVEVFSTDEKGRASIMRVTIDKR